MVTEVGCWGILKCRLSGVHGLIDVTTLKHELPETFCFAQPNKSATWKRRFLCFRTVPGKVAKAEIKQVDALIYLMFPQAEDMFRTSDPRRNRTTFSLPLQKVW